MRKQNLLGQKFGFLEVIAEGLQLNGRSTSVCRCICGTEKVYPNKELKRKLQSCGCKTKEIISQKNTRDLSKQKFHSLQPIEIVGTKRKRKLWKCKCDCGNYKKVVSDDLIQGHVVSCGLCQRSTLPKDLTGQKFGKLVVLEKVEKLNGKTAWKCQCECGQIKIITQNNLISNHSESCGCEINYIKKNPIGQQFGRLIVIGDFDSQGSSRYYLCKCSCGQETIVSNTRLQKGTTKSCGCLRKELAAKRMSLLTRDKNPNWKGGAAIDYDARKTKEYNQWRKAVLKSGGRVCCICGENHNLQAHHLNSFLGFPEQRYDVNNGVVLCIFCHKLFHAEYGSGDNTKEQFAQFQKALGL